MSTMYTVKVMHPPYTKSEYVESVSITGGKVCKVFYKTSPNLSDAAIRLTWSECFSLIAFLSDYFCHDGFTVVAFTTPSSCTIPSSSDTDALDAHIYAGDRT
jgi:hypothetical protein